MAIGTGWAEGAWVDAGWVTEAWSDVAPSASVVLSTGIVTEADVQGSTTVVLTLSNDTFVSSDAAKLLIAGGLDSDLSEAAGWDAIVKAGLVAGDVVLSAGDTVATITISFPSYDITANETITATIPASALTISAIGVVATPAFGVSFIPAASTTPTGRASTRAGAFVNTTRQGMLTNTTRVSAMSSTTRKGSF